MDQKSLPLLLHLNPFADDHSAVRALHTAYSRKTFAQLRASDGPTTSAYCKILYMTLTSCSSCQTHQVGRTAPYIENRHGSLGIFENMAGAWRLPKMRQCKVHAL